MSNIGKILFYGGIGVVIGAKVAFDKTTEFYKVDPEDMINYYRTAANGKLDGIKDTIKEKTNSCTKSNKEENVEVVDKGTEEVETATPVEATVVEDQESSEKKEQ